VSALRRLNAWAALVVALSAAAGYAARSLPNDAQFVEEAEFSYPYVKAGKDTLRLAVSARIYSEQNLIIMPAAAPAKASVLFKTDINGEVSRVWILTDDEAQAFKEKDQ
jgi:hypothetical protein